MTVCGDTHGTFAVVLSMTMAGEIRTRETLLMRIRNLGDADAWRQFLEIYQPVIQGYLRRRGLRDADAADVAQETLGAVAKNIERFKYDPSKGHFRGWLLTIARRRAFAVRRAPPDPRPLREPDKPRRTRCSIRSPRTTTTRRQWERDCEQQALQWAMNQMKSASSSRKPGEPFTPPPSKSAPPQRIAEELGVTVSAVYTARSRVTARLRQVIDELEGGS